MKFTFKPIEPPDLHYVNAAEGWVELGDHAEASKELENVCLNLRSHPAVLKVRWGVYAKAKSWLLAVVMGETLVRLTPEDPFGWIHRSLALHEMKRTQEAWDKLWPAAARFPNESTIPYHLACYSCQLGHLGQARGYLDRAMALGDKQQIKHRALRDPDLKPLRFAMTPVGVV